MLMFLFLPLLSLAAFPFFVGDTDSDNEIEDTPQSQDPETDFASDFIFDLLGVNLGTTVPSTEDTISGGDGDTGTDTITDVVDDNVVLINGTEYLGDDNDDIFKLNPDDDFFVGLNIEAGDGDDQILLVDQDLDELDVTTTDNTTIDGGSGDYLIEFSGRLNYVVGGTGDDTINGYHLVPDSRVYGGEGDDHLWADNQSADSILLDGGSGNDTIDMRDIDNGLGDGGDDLIYASGLAIWDGTGYVATADGGAGNDTISFVSNDEFIGDSYFTEIMGGEGSDTFELTVNEGEIFTGAYDDGYQPGYHENILSNENGVIRIVGVSINDFDPQQDTLEIDVATANEEYTATTARLETGEDRDGEQQMFLVIRYESDTELTRDLLIGLGDVDLDINDINFVGDKIPQLIS